VVIRALHKTLHETMRLIEHPLKLSLSLDWRMHFAGLCSLGVTKQVIVQRHNWVRNENIGWLSYSKGISSMSEKYLSKKAQDS